MTTLATTTPNGSLVLSTSSAEYANAAISDSTWRAYESDLRAFVAWGGTMPATPEMVCDWISAMAQAGRAAATIQRRLSSLSVIHEHEGLENPTRHQEVRRVHKGIRRTIGTAANKKAAMTSADLKAYFASLNGDLRSLRDKTILAWGLSTACRRSELAALCVEDLTAIDAGYRVRIKRSKTDQISAGRNVAVVYGADPNTDPIRLMRSWLERAGITSGPIFRPIAKGGKVGSSALSSRSIASAVKRCAAALEKDVDTFSGHSLRRGFVSETARAGASEREIAKQTGHRSMVVLRGYIEESTVEVDNAVSKLGL